MKLKGDWSALVTYDVDDVVRFENGEIHHLERPCPAAVSPLETRYWGKIFGPIAPVISMMIDLMNDTNTALATVTAAIPTNIDDEGIVLKGTEDAEYLITVDDSGDTPELDVALIESEESGEGGES